MASKKYPNIVYELAEKTLSIVKKHGCYVDEEKWQCPCFVLEMECDTNCKCFILNAVKASWDLQFVEENHPCHEQITDAAKKWWKQARVKLERHEIPSVPITAVDIIKERADKNEMG